MGLSEERVEELARAALWDLAPDLIRRSIPATRGALRAAIKEATAAERERLMEDSCSWHEDEDGVWWTECDNAFALETGTPSENEMQFCCYCGRRLAELAESRAESADRILGLPDRIFEFRASALRGRGGRKRPPTPARVSRPEEE